MQSKKSILIYILSAVCIAAAAILAIIAVKTTRATLPNQSSYESSSASKAGSGQPSEITDASNTSQSDIASSGNIQTSSFYKNVKYHSPQAKPADIFKHGRNLMLLNNDWELPEDFKWDLVYWSNGHSVDALSLNYPEYDKVFAVDRAAYQPLKDMFAAAQGAGVPLQMVSPYRSIQKQDRLFTESVNYYINQGNSESEAIKKANISRTFTGTSEHNTGFGFDILEKGNWTLSDSFDKTAQFKWLKENAEKYGFILRYPKDKTDITGIMYEPWHFRYVGVEHAKKINSMVMCLEEYIEYLDGEI